MKRVIADVITGAHGVHLAARRLQGAAPGLDMNGSTGFTPVRVPRFQVSEKFLAGGVSGRRTIVVERSKGGAQRSCARRGNLAADGIVVVQVEPAQQRSKC